MTDPERGVAALVKLTFSLGDDDTAAALGSGTSRSVDTGAMDESLGHAASVEFTFCVTEADTAVALGSGSLPVLGTPRLLAWCEAATCRAIEPALIEGRTSVGTRMDLQHSSASPVGAEVVVSADPAYADGRLHRFQVSARHTDGKIVATGEITRVIVDTDRFLGRLA